MTSNRSRTALFVVLALTASALFAGCIVRPNQTAHTLQPQPVVYTQPVVVHRPAPVVVQPAPVVVRRPAPVVYRVAPVVVHRPSPVLNPVRINLVSNFVGQHCVPGAQRHCEHGSYCHSSSVQYCNPDGMSWTPCLETRY